MKVNPKERENMKDAQEQGEEKRYLKEEQGEKVHGELTLKIYRKITIIMMIITMMNIILIML